MYYAFTLVRNRGLIFLVYMFLLVGLDIIGLVCWFGWLPKRDMIYYNTPLQFQGLEVLLLTGNPWDSLCELEFVGLWSPSSLRVSARGRNVL